MVDPAALPWLLFAAGVGLGLALGLFGGALLGGRQRRVLERALDAAERGRQAETDVLLDGVKGAFADISNDAYRRTAEDLQRTAQAALAVERRSQAHQLSSERAEFEARLGGVLSHLEKLGATVRSLERDREAKFGELTQQLRQAGEEARELTRTTQKLAATLSNPRSRGQWGERLAEDVLRSLGLREGVNYHRQRALASGVRPDFTFVLPGGRSMHMDVKFPFDNWARSLDAADPGQAQRHRLAFLRDAKARIDEVAARGYATPDQGSLDTALLFIPNEAVFAALTERAPDLLDRALAKRVLLVSPFTLYAVLAVVRDAAERHRLATNAAELHAQLASLRKAWRDWRGHALKAEAGLEEAVDQLRGVAVGRRRAVEREMESLEALLGETRSPGDGRGYPNTPPGVGDEASGPAAAQLESSINSSKPSGPTAA